MKILQKIFAVVVVSNIFILITLSQALSIRQDIATLMQSQDKEAETSFSVVDDFSFIIANQNRPLSIPRTFKIVNHFKDCQTHSLPDESFANYPVENVLSGYHPFINFKYPLSEFTSDG